MSRPIWLTYITDAILFLVGIAIVLKQTGIYFEPPKGGPQIELIILGGLFCNGPLMLQVLALRFGTGGQSAREVPSVPASSSEPSSGPSSGGS